MVGDSSFLTNGGLLDEGNAALAMNLAGSRPTVIWYAPQHGEGAGSVGDASLTDLIPDQVTWLVVQLVVAVALLILLPPFGNHGLWAALMVLNGARGLTMARLYPRVERAAA